MHPMLRYHYLQMVCATLTHGKGYDGDHPHQIGLLPHANPELDGLGALSLLIVNNNHSHPFMQQLAQVTLRRHACMPACCTQTCPWLRPALGCSTSHSWCVSPNLQGDSDWALLHIFNQRPSEAHQPAKTPWFVRLVDRACDAAGLEKAAKTHLARNTAMIKCAAGG